MNFYIASSWRNPHQPKVVDYLRLLGHEVYDFRHPVACQESRSRRVPVVDDYGFQWSEIDPEWRSWNLAQYLDGLGHESAERGFGLDFQAMADSDACVLVLPSGRSSHLEAGWFVGAGKPLIVLSIGPLSEPELMYKMADAVCGGELVSVALFELGQVVRLIDLQAQGELAAPKGTEDTE